MQFAKKGDHLQLTLKYQHRDKVVNVPMPQVQRVSGVKRCAPERPGAASESPPATGLLLWVCVGASLRATRAFALHRVFRKDTRTAPCELMCELTLRIGKRGGKGRLLQTLHRLRGLWRPLLNSVQVAESLSGWLLPGGFSRGRLLSLGGDLALERK